VPVNNVPESYNVFYDKLKSAEEKIEPKCMEQMLVLSGLEQSVNKRIMDLVNLNDNNNPLFVTQNAFYLFLALVALAQAGEDLPTPTFQSIEPVASKQNAQQDKLNQWLSDLDTISLLRVHEREGSFLFSHFEENRTKGLERFINAVARHPVLAKDDVVTVFLSSPLTIRDWQHNRNITVDEEFVKFAQDIRLIEKKVPIDWEDRIQRMKKRTSRSIIQYERMLLIMRHMVQFKKSLGTDYIRYGLTINGLIESEKGCLFQSCRGCPQLAQGQSQVAKSMQQAGMMLNREAVTVSDNVINSLIEQKELLESFKELLERKEAPCTVSNEVLAGQLIRNKIRAVPALSPIQQRQIFIKYAILSEMSFIHKLQIHLSNMYNRWVKDESLYANSWIDLWSQLEIITHPMPQQPSDFP
ncbi:hypothetical protein BY458DRAFT_434497, partial [Sporodiniella umbellata]